jgi:general secretion pathway protein C
MTDVSVQGLKGLSVSRWGVRLATLVVWAVLACAVMYWVLQWPRADAARADQPATLSVAGDELSTPAPTPAAMGRALGAPSGGGERAAAPSLAARLSLQGVVRAGTHDGAALIVIDGKPARSVRVGMEVEPGLYLLALEPRRASLGPDPRGGESLSLELPRPKTP